MIVPLMRLFILLALPHAVAPWSAQSPIRWRAPAAACGGLPPHAAPTGPRRAVLPKMQSGTSLDKPQFGGGSGGTATLDGDFSVNTILKQLESIQQGTPKNIVILGTRHCSFLHQQIIEVHAAHARLFFPRGARSACPPAARKCDALISVPARSPPCAACPSAPRSPSPTHAAQCPPQTTLRPVRPPRSSQTPCTRSASAPSGQCVTSRRNSICSNFQCHQKNRTMKRPRQNENDPTSKR